MCGREVESGGMYLALPYPLQGGDGGGAASAELIPRPKHMERQAVDVELQMPDDCLSLTLSPSATTPRRRHFTTTT